MCIVGRARGRRVGFFCLAGTRVVTAGGAQGSSLAPQSTVDFYEGLTGAWTVYNGGISQARYRLSCAVAYPILVFAGGQTAESGASIESVRTA